VCDTETRAVVQNQMLRETGTAIEFLAATDERTDKHLSVT